VAKKTQFKNSKQHSNKSKNNCTIVLPIAVWAYLVVVVGRVAAAPGAAAADSSAGRGQSTGPLHGAAGLLKGQGPGGLWSRVVDMVDEVVSVAVVVNVAPGLLRGRRLQAA